MTLTTDFLPAVIRIGLDPEIDLGPLQLSWHGLMIALGVAAGGWLATVYARERGLERDRVIDLVVVVALAGIVGARVFYLVEHGDLLRPGAWLGTFGFSIYGAVILGPLAGAAYMRWRGLGMRYLDAAASGFPLGLMVGRTGDLINGEHYGPASDLPWAVINAHPEADVPSQSIAYHSGGLYEVLLGLVLFALVWPLRGRFRTPGVLLFTVIALYAAGRFAMFFARSDSEALTLGLNGAQWTSLALLVVSIVAIVVLRRRRDPAGKRLEGVRTASTP